MSALNDAIVAHLANTAEVDKLNKLLKTAQFQYETDEYLEKLVIVISRTKATQARIHRLTGK